MTTRGKNRQFPTAYKLKAIKRAEGGEIVSLGVVSPGDEYSPKVGIQNSLAGLGA